MPKPKWLGDFEQINIPDPGAGAGVNIQPPAGQIWLVVGFYALFTCSAAVANRYSILLWRGGALDLGHVINFGVHVALSVTNVTGSIVVKGNPYNTLNYDVFPLGEFCYITNTLYLRLDTVNIQAADQWSGLYINYWRMLAE